MLGAGLPGYEPDTPEPHERQLPTWMQEPVELPTLQSSQVLGRLATTLDIDADKLPPAVQLKLYKEELERLEAEEVEEVKANQKLRAAQGQAKQDQARVTCVCSGRRCPQTCGCQPRWG